MGTVDILTVAETKINTSFPKMSSGYSKEIFIIFTVFTNDIINLTV